ncbi:sigma-54-dependent transcriptional regulator [Luteimonas terrae]|uniref:Sigma-54-dependent Fis family transcriptional regulator n=1 Tax=Luteimonas terrae TaxID=1530191 RepID=A0A4R5U5M1_9GAMM|nr:sigma 54-interacting transcriptional regulator [Luteimonas terrae]TDK28996.1 sigma-54-dependent Fis family transcriptional regulator [Luteimonas terrae]
MSDILIIDDDSSFAASAAELARLEGFAPRLATTVAQAREQLRRDSDLLLLDLELPDGSGMELFPDIDPDRHGRIVIITGHPSVETAMRAVSGPVSDYLIKPFDPKTLIALLRETRRIARMVDVPGSEPIPGVFATSAAMHEPTRLARALAATDASVLLTGETGTGKDLFARAIHAMSDRRGRFVRLECGSTPRDRLVDQLFGVPGGAGDAFADADGGTLFVDEIDELPLDLQGALLQRIERQLDVASASGLQDAPVRIVAASRLEPESAMSRGHLREDLYYRIADVHIPLPALRQREDDALLLARRVVQALNLRYDLEKRLSPKSARVLRHHLWPGNVRELQNAVHRAYMTASGNEIVVALDTSRAPAPIEGGDTIAFTLGTPWAEIERRMLLKALAHCDNDKTAAARLLGISVRTVHNHLARMKDRDPA